MKYTTIQWKIILSIVLVLILVFLVFPFVWTFLTSITPTGRFYTDSLQLIPKNPTLVNYKDVLSEARFTRAMFNSLSVALLSCLLSMTVSLMAAYACARFKFRIKKHVLIGFILVHMFPPVLLLMPLFTTMRTLGLIGSRFGLVISYNTFTIPFSVWLLTGYINDISVEFEQAARIDGCSRVGAFLRIVLPLASPSIVAAAIYIFIYSWNEFLFASMFTNETTQTLPIALYHFIGEYYVNWQFLSSGGIITSVPVIILFMIIQKRLVEGLTAGGVKE